MAPATTEDSPIILDRRAGVGGIATPAGMYPDSMTAQVHQGRNVPEESKVAFSAATGKQLEGAELQRNADRQYYEHVRDNQALRMQATEDARVQHARVQAERDAMVKRRLAGIEALNAEAAAKISPSKYWHDRGAAASAVGAIMVGLGSLASRLSGGPNTTLQIIENGINREIDAQVKNSQIAGQNSQRAQVLLQMHLERLGDMDKAIDATKLALWDNVAQQVETYKADHAAQISEANLANVQAGILEKRGEVVNKIALQETDDVNKSATQRWHNATMVGGTGGGAGSSMEGYEIIPVPASDQTAERGQMIAVPKGVHGKLAEAVGFTNAIVGINQDALQRIERLKKDIPKAAKGDAEAFKRVQANRKTLEDLAQRKASLTSQAEGQGVLKEAEYDRAMKDRVMFNDWWKPGFDTKQIQAQNNGLVGAAGRLVQGAGGQRVKMAYKRTANGELQPHPLFTGQPFTPAPTGPEMDEVADPRKGK